MDAIRPWLYVGKYRETLSASFLRAREIDTMLQLAEAIEHPGITSLYLPVEDGVPIPTSLLQQGADFVLSEKRQGRTVLIACGAGISRSVAFAVAVLKEDEGLSLLEAVQSVKKRHPESMPHPALWQSLCDYYNEEIPISAMLRALWDSE
jgi:atypical dual specificity phosphatase